MLQIHKALVLWRHFFGYDPTKWACEFQEGTHKAVLQQTGWRVEIWGKPKPSFSHLSLTYDHKAFLRPSEYLLHDHTLDLWVSGVGRVMSAQWDGRNLVLIDFRPGKWEHHIFHLPEEKAQADRDLRSPSFSTFGHAA